MEPDSRDAAACKEGDALARPYRGLPMRDDDGRSPCTGVREGGMDGRLRLVIDRRRGFIEHQNPGVSEKHASDRQALSLSA